jgi:hypothetical protein
MVVFLVLSEPYGGFTYIVLKSQFSNKPSVSGSLNSWLAFTIEYSLEHGSRSISCKTPLMALIYFDGVPQW